MAEIATPTKKAAPKVEEPRKTRTPKSTTQKAQEALDVATRKVAKLEAAQKRVEQELTVISRELKDAQDEKAYLASHPALRKTEEA